MANPNWKEGLSEYGGTVSVNDESWKKGLSEYGGVVGDAIQKPFLSRVLDETVNSAPVQLFKNIQGAVAEPLLKLGTGLIAKPVSEIGGLAAMLRDLISGNKDGDPSGFKDELANNLTYEPRTASGKSSYNPLNAIPSAIGNIVGKVSNTAADVVAGDNPGVIRSGISNAVREAIPQSLGFAGVKGGKGYFTPERLAKKIQASDVLTAQQKPLADLVQNSRDAGLSIPLTAANPSILNRVIEGTAGKAAIDNAISIKNSPIFNSLAKKEIGVADNVPLTPETFDAVRKKAGSAYEDLKQVGQFSADDLFTNRIAEIKKQTESVGDFKTLKNSGIDDLVSDLNKKNFDSVDVVRLMKELRAKSNKNIKSEIPETNTLGMAQKDSAKALESLVERNLKEADAHFPGNGYAEISKNFSDAREVIAKSYNLQKATDLLGNVDPKVLTRQLESGKPLTGNLKLLAQFGDKFKKATKQNSDVTPINTNPIASSILGVGGYAALGSGGLAAALAPTGINLARTGIRSAILNPKLQEILASVPDNGVSQLSRIPYDIAKKIK